MSKQNDSLKKYSKVNQSSPVAKILGVLILIIALIGGTAYYFKQQSELDRQLAKQSRLLEQYNQLTADNIAIEAEINSIDTDEYIKKMAREHLGMVWPNQVVFKSGVEQDGGND